MSLRGTTQSTQSVIGKFQTSETPLLSGNSYNGQTIISFSGSQFQVSYNTSSVIGNELNNPTGGSSIGSRRASHESFNGGATDQIQASDVVQLPDGSSSRMRIATTMPEIGSVQQQQKPMSSSPEKRHKKKLPPVSSIPTSQSEHALSVRNIGLHNEHLAAQDTRQKRNPKLDQPVDLDQTTMIGSALDLDSLSDVEHEAHVHDVDDDESRVSAGAGSQVGLLKMTTSTAA